MCWFRFFFIDTSNTDIYPYGHTLSLHDALPIWLWHGFVQDVGEIEAGPLDGDNPQIILDRGDHRRKEPAALTGPDDGARVVAQATRIGRRSEEHTSELQSLMRISYAVFCLKKKTTTTQRSK